MHTASTWRKQAALRIESGDMSVRNKFFAVVAVVPVIPCLIGLGIFLWLDRKITKHKTAKTVTTEKGDCGCPK